MGGIKKFFLLIGILVLITVNTALYWGRHLYFRADKESNEINRLQLLDQSAGLIPFDAEVYFELGNVFYEKAVRSLNDPRIHSRYLEDSIEAFRKSIRLEPGAYKTHYALARALRYANYLQEDNPDFFSEYWKAAQLTTFDNDIYFEIGRILFSLWPELKDSQQEFTLEMLKNVIQSKGNERLWQILQTWAAHVAEYDVMESILPEEPDTYRMYARFLGERSLSLAQRRLKLAQAEYLEFENARTRFAQAQTDFRLYRLTQANNKYRDVHRMLKNIDFYQNLQSGNGFIDKSEYKNLYKLSLLGIIQSYALQPETMTQVKEYFDQYLEIENDPATMERLEEFLTERGWLEITPGGQNNPLRLYYRIHLDYKQSRYREIIGFVQLAEEMTYDLPGQYRDELNDIFRLIGNAYQNIDFLYDAVDMYEKALQLIPNDWRTLFQLRASYVRFNNQEKIAEVDKRLSMILTNREEIFNRVKLEKNQGWAYPFLLRPGNFIINMAITPEKTMFPPLVSIYLNGEIIQEDYVPVSASSGEIILPVSLDSVQNHLQIKSINQDIYLETFNIRNHDE
jgi:hypothetical protein